MDALDNDATSVLFTFALMWFRTEAAKQSGDATERDEKGLANKDILTWKQPLQAARQGNPD